MKRESPSETLKSKEPSSPSGDLQAEIAKRAYELWEANGRVHGNDLAHWYQAESEVSGKLSIPTKTCLYCGLDWPADEFSDEHIWPDALGGSYLTRLWRSNEVCAKCNSLSGLFVDGSFIKSWLGANERSFGARDYISLADPTKTILPLNYMGPLANVPTREGEIAEYWTGPCGANIVHIRPNDSQEVWGTYAGGDPRANKSRAGRAYIALTSSVPFWIVASLASFKAHFKKAERFIVNMDVPPQWSNIFKTPNATDPIQAGDLAVVNVVTSAGRERKYISVKLAISKDVGTRLLAKLGLAIGYKLFGAPFLTTEYAKYLRKGLFERDSEKRRKIPVRGSGFLTEQRLGQLGKTLSWPGAWILILMVVERRLHLGVISPSGKSMGVVVCDDATLISGLDRAYTEGLVWLTVPSLGVAVNDIPLPDYLAHRTRTSRLPALEAIEAKRVDAATLPPC